MLVILVALSGSVGAVAMPTLGAVLIFAAVKSLRPGEITMVWSTAHTGKIALLMIGCISREWNREMVAQVHHAQVKDNIGTILSSRP